MWKQATHARRTKNVLAWLEAIPFMGKARIRDEPCSGHETKCTNTEWRDTSVLLRSLICLVRRVTYQWNGPDEEPDTRIIWKNGWSYRKLRDAFMEEQL